MRRVKTGQKSVNFMANRRFSVGDASLERQARIAGAVPVMPRIAVIAKESSSGKPCRSIIGNATNAFAMIETLNAYAKGIIFFCPTFSGQSRAENRRKVAPRRPSPRVVLWCSCWAENSSKQLKD